MALLGSMNLMLFWAHKPNAINFLPREVTQADSIYGPGAQWGGRGRGVFALYSKARRQH